MRKLFAFLYKYSVVILFLLLEIVSFGMIVRNNNYPQSVFFSSSNSITASLYAFSNDFIEFFYLKSVNSGLANENTLLKNKVIQLENKLDALEKTLPDTSHYQVDAEKEISFVNARVISNSTNKLLNYITLNKGARDGIKSDMGVVNEDGVVGIVAGVSEKFSVVIPVLNPRVQINAKFIKNNYSGPIQWDGGDYRFANLKDIARHVQFALGDSLITSGYTYSFPEGILIGRVESFNIKDSESYYNIKVKLAVNFRTLSYVKVLNFINLEEQKKLEQKVSQ